MRSTPSCASRRASATDCSTSQPPSAQSVAEIRTNSGRSAGPDRAHRAGDLEQQPDAVVERRRRTRRRGGWRAARGTRGAGSRARRGSRSPGTRRRAPARRRRRRRRPRPRSPPRPARGAPGRPSGRGRRSAPRVRQPPSPSGPPPPSHGGAVLALRPACASWMPAAAPLLADEPREAAAAARRARPSRCRGPAGEIRPSGVTAVASVMTSAGAAHGPAAEVDQVPVVGEAVGARVLAHRAHDDAVPQLERAERERREQRRRDGHAQICPGPQLAVKEGERPRTAEVAPELPLGGRLDLHAHGTLPGQEDSWRVNGWQF